MQNNQCTQNNQNVQNDLKNQNVQTNPNNQQIEEINLSDINKWLSKKINDCNLWRGLDAVK